MSLPVHRCGYASQPDIQIACDGAWTTPDWCDPHAPGVYWTDESPRRLYTFTDARVTCPKCLGTDSATAKP